MMTVQTCSSWLTNGELPASMTALSLTSGNAMCLNLLHSQTLTVINYHWQFMSHISHVNLHTIAILVKCNQLDDCCIIYKTLHVSVCSSCSSLHSTPFKAQEFFPSQFR